MIVDVDPIKFDLSLGELSRFVEAATSIEKTISGAISDSEVHIKTNAGKIASKIETWNKRLKILLGSRNQCDHYLKTYRSELKVVMARANRLNKDMKYERDPDKAKGIQNEINSNNNELIEIQEKIEKQQEKMQRIEADIKTACTYLSDLKRIKAVNEESKKDIEVAKEYFTNAYTDMREGVKRCSAAIGKMRRHIEAFNSTSYSAASYEGSAPHISIPTMHRTASLPKRPEISHTQPSGRAGTSHFAIPSKMRIVANDDPLIEVIGVYGDKEELGKNLAQVKNQYKKFTLCIKKPITDATPCFDNIKLLADYLSEQGLKAKMTPLGTRYTDFEGKIYFIY